MAQNDSGNVVNGTQLRNKLREALLDGEGERLQRMQEERERTCRAFWEKVQFAEDWVRETLPMEIRHQAAVGFGNIHLTGSDRRVPREMLQFVLNQLRTWGVTVSTFGPKDDVQHWIPLDQFR